MVRVGGLDAQALADASLQTARAAEEEHAGRLGAGEPGGAIYLVPPLVVAFAGSPAVEQIVSHSVEEEISGLCRYRRSRMHRRRRDRLSWYSSTWRRIDHGMRNDPCFGSCEGFTRTTCRGTG